MAYRMAGLAAGPTLGGCSGHIRGHIPPAAGSGLQPSPLFTKSKRAPRLASSRPAAGHSRLCVVSQSSPQGPNKVVPPSQKRLIAFWSSVDVTAWLGTVGTTLAFLLTQEALLVAGPVLLPLLALYAGRQRDQLSAKAAQAQLQQTLSSTLRQLTALSEESADMMAEQLAEVAETARRGRSVPDKVLRSMEAKLSAVEGSTLSAAGATREALKETAAQQVRSTREVAAALGALRQDLGEDIRQAAGGEAEVLLSKVDARLAAVEESLTGLEFAQTEAMRRLGAQLSSVMADSGKAVVAAVRAEARASMEPVRQLPQLIADAAQSSQLSEDTLRAVIAEEMEAAAVRATERQRVMLAEAAAGPATVAPKQWNQLGKRLLALDGQLEALRVQGETSREGLVTAATAAAQMGAVQSELAALTQSVQAALQSVGSTPASGGEVEDSLGALTGLSSRLDAFSEVLLGVQQRLDALVAAPAGRKQGAGAAPAVLQPSQGESERREAYGRMQALLRVEGELLSSSLDEGANGMGSQSAALDAAAAAAGGEVAEPGQLEAFSGSSGLPISAWLSADSSDEEDQPAEAELQPQLQASSAAFDAVGQAAAGSAFERGGGVDAEAAGPLPAQQVETDTSSASEYEAALPRSSDDATPEVGNGSMPVAGDGVLVEANGGMPAAPLAAQQQPSTTAPAWQGDLKLGEMYNRGLQLLRQGRALAAQPGADLGVAEAAFYEASECFQTVLQQEPDNVKALGNSGNVFMAHGSLKSRVLEAARSAAEAAAGSVAPDAIEASKERLAEEAEELLVVAGRRFKRVLELDPEQARAFVNWGRVVGLRAELRLAQGQEKDAIGLFENAAEKFEAALELGADAGLTCKLAGRALFTAAQLMMAAEPYGFPNDPSLVEPTYDLMKEAERFLERALQVDPADEEAREKLEACKLWE